MAAAGKSTDIYAFGLLVHEILSRTRPFDTVVNPFEIAMKVCNGIRPDLDKLPTDCPPAIVAMIVACWDSDRTKRPNAIQCLAVTEQALAVVESKKFDVFFSHRWMMKAFLSHVYHYLTQKGYRVWYDMAEMGYDLTKSMQEGIDNSYVSEDYHAFISLCLGLFSLHSIFTLTTPPHSPSL